MDLLMNLYNKHQTIIFKGIHAGRTESDGEAHNHCQHTQTLSLTFKSGQKICRSNPCPFGGGNEDKKFCER